MQGESGGDETVPGDGGNGYGLMKDRVARTPVGTDAKTQIRNAWNLVANNPDQWHDWGEGTSYNGQPFGALGRMPYPGDEGKAYQGQSAGTGTAAPETPSSGAAAGSFPGNLLTRAAEVLRP